MNCLDHHHVRAIMVPMQFLFASIMVSMQGTVDRLLRAKVIYTTHKRLSFINEILKVAIFNC